MLIFLSCFYAVCFSAECFSAVCLFFLAAFLLYAFLLNAYVLYAFLLNAFLLSAYVQLSQNNMWQKCEGMNLNGFSATMNEPNPEKKNHKQIWEPFGICLLNSTVNLVLFQPKLGWIGCAI